MHLETRTTAIFLLVGVLIISAFIGIHNAYFSQAPLRVALENAQAKAAERESYLRNFLNDSNSQLKAVSQSQSFQQLRLNNNEQTRKQLSDVMLTVIRSAPYMMQLRVLDSQGDELIRVERKALNQEAQIVNQHDLQNKSNRPYFNDALRAPIGEIHYSAIDLNIEQGQIEVPLKPTLRLSYKTDSSQGHLLLISNYFISPVLQNLFYAPLYKMTLVDRSGHIVYHDNPELRWSAQFPERPSLQELPAFAQHSHSILTEDLYQSPEFISVRLKLPFDPELFLIFQLNQHFLEQQQQEQQNLYLLVTTFTLSIMLVLSILASRLIFSGRTLDSVKKLEQIYSATFNQASIGLVHLDMDGMIKRTNPKFNEILGFDGKELIGQYITDLMHKEDSVDENSKRINLITGDQSVLQGTYRMRNKHSETLWVQQTLSAIFDPSTHQFLFFLALYENVSDKILLEHSLRQAKERAEHANLAKSQFLANMSHEVRTPLNGVIGLTDLVLETTLNDSQRNYLEKSQESAHSLLSILNDILDFSQLETETLKLNNQVFSLEHVLLQVINSFHYSAEHKNNHIFLSYSHDLQDKFRGDAIRLRQILSNLLGNAVKFTQNGDINIRVETEWQTEESVHLRFSISDTGIGIKPSQLKHIFDSFQQVDNSDTRLYGGIGLGLSICKHLVEKMNGEISVESHEGDGSTFSFTVDLMALPESYSMKLTREILQALNIVVVTKDPDQEQQISKILTSWQANYYLCKQIKEATEYAQNHTIDLAIIDLSSATPADFIDTQTLNQTMHKNIVAISAMYDMNRVQHNLVAHEIHQTAVVNQPLTASKLLETIDQFFKHEDFANMDQSQIASQLRQTHHEKRILLVEDNEINQMVMQEQLEGLGCEVTIASNGKEAIMFALRGRFDAILMDLQMPVMDGFEATKTIRKLDLDTPIIAVSAAVMPEDIEQAMLSGMNTHIAKPASKEALAQVLKIHTHRT